MTIVRIIINDDIFPDGFLTTENFPDLESLNNLGQAIVDDIGPILDQNKEFIASVGFGFVFAIIR